MQVFDYKDCIQYFKIMTYKSTIQLVVGDFFVSIYICMPLACILLWAWEKLKISFRGSKCWESISDIHGQRHGSWNTTCYVNLSNVLVWYKHLKLISGKFKSVVSYSVLLLNIDVLYTHGSYGINCRADVTLCTRQMTVFKLRKAVAGRYFIKLHFIAIF